MVKTEAQTVEFVRRGRKKDPDLELEFRDNNRGLGIEGNSYLYGFSLGMFLSELSEQGAGSTSYATNIANDNVRINITNLLNFNAEILRADRKSMSAEDRAAVDEASKEKYASVQKERIYEFVSVDDTFNLVDPPRS